MLFSVQMCQFITPLLLITWCIRFSALCKHNPLTLIENSHHVFTQFELRIIYWSVGRLEQIQNVLKSSLCNITVQICGGSLGCGLQVSGWIYRTTVSNLHSLVFYLFLFLGFNVSRNNEYIWHLYIMLLTLSRLCLIEYVCADMNEINVENDSLLIIICFSKTFSQQPDRKLISEWIYAFVLPSQIYSTA